MIASMRKYDCALGGGPSRYASSAYCCPQCKIAQECLSVSAEKKLFDRWIPTRRTCWASLSASEYTATVRMPSLRAVLITRTAISPRFAMRILSKSGRRETDADSADVLSPCSPRVYLSEPATQKREGRLSHEKGTLWCVPLLPHSQTDGSKRGQ
jgi:hypothetical protein